MKCKQGMYNFMKFHSIPVVKCVWNEAPKDANSFLSFCDMANLQNHQKNLRFRERVGVGLRWPTKQDNKHANQTTVKRLQTTQICFHTKKLAKKRAGREEGGSRDKDKNETLWASKRKCNRSAKFGSEREILWYIHTQSIGKHAFLSYIFRLKYPSVRACVCGCVLKLTWTIVIVFAAI